MTARILLIDDEPQIRRFMRISICAEGFQFAEAKTGGEGLALLQSYQPDLVILDLGLPDMDGYEILKSIRKVSKIPVLVLTARDIEDEKVKLLNGGANDYLSKPFGVKELIARLKVLLRDLSPALRKEDSPRLNFLNLSLDITNHQVWLDGVLLTLSRKEFSLLRELALQADKLVPQQELIERIWGSVYVENSHYLRILVSQLRKKLRDDADDPKFIITEPGVGYRLLSGLR